MGEWSCAFCCLPLPEGHSPFLINKKSLASIPFRDTSSRGLGPLLPQLGPRKKLRAPLCIPEDANQCKGHSYFLGWVHPHNK